MHVKLDREGGECRNLEINKDFITLDRLNIMSSDDHPEYDIRFSINELFFEKSIGDFNFDHLLHAPKAIYFR